MLMIGLVPTGDRSRKCDLIEKKDRIKVKCYATYNDINIIK